VLIILAALALIAGWALWHKNLPLGPGGTPVSTHTPGAPEHTSVGSTPSPRPPTPTRTPRSTPARKRIGILAGHSGPEHDPGAICPDGLHEADINLAVAQKVQAILTAKGYDVDLLEEFDERLKGYRADAFLAIHTDSCEFPEASGFKVAHVTASAIPEVEDRLVECLYNEYGRASGLPRHDFSITPDMHEYHAFMQIAPETPGAIIELGFMAGDRYILVKHQDELAAGIVAGLQCFLQQQ
jgi:N-acetylmuramoyl-L-alanine amidase